MAKGKPGADSSVPVTARISGKGLIQLAVDLYGETPVFWGRYFTSAASGGTVEYRHRRENQPLHDSSIRLLPIARQTRRVNGTIADGTADALANVDDFIATFGAEYLASQGGQFYMFLDVEGAPSLSAPYYTGWAQALSAHSLTVTGGTVELLPCVYGTQADSPTWTALAAAAAAGVDCRGVWIARWISQDCHALPDWDDAMVTPRMGLPCPVLIWQYAADCHGGGGFDCSEVNPSINLDDDLLAFLVLPPDMTGQL